MRFPLPLAAPLMVPEAAVAEPGTTTTAAGAATTDDPTTATAAATTAATTASATADAATTTTTTTDTAATTTTAADGTASTAPKPPEKYALTVPETAPVTTAMLAEFERLARADGLTNEQAQAHLDRFLATQQAQHTALLTATKADREIGGDQLPVAQARMQQVLDRFMPASDPDRAELNDWLRTSGSGNYRVLLKLLARIGNASAEDFPPHLGTGPAHGGVSVADRLYPTTVGLGKA